MVSRLSGEWARTHQVRIAVFDSSDPAYEYGGALIDMNLPALKGSPLSQVRQAIRRIIALTRLFRAERPCRIITFTESANYPAILATVLIGYTGRLWVSVRNDPGRLPRAHRHLIPFLYRIPARVVAVSEGVANDLGALGLPHRKLLSIPNPAPTNAPRITDMIAKPERAPKQYILGVGRLHRQKGFDRLLDAFARLEDKSQHLVILGEGPERAQLQSQATCLGIADRLHLIGAERNVWPWYRHAQCFVLSSRYEGWPNVLLEAMSQGCPVVSFACRHGPSEVTEDGRSGVLVPDGDIGGLSKAIEEVLHDTERRRSVLEAGLRRVSALNCSQISAYWVGCPAETVA